MKAKKMLTILALALGLMVWQVEVSEAEPMGTAWTYQGRLIDANEAAEGLYDFQFKLFNDPCTGAQQGSTVDVNDLDVIDGYFTLELDFGSDVFDGDARWLETTVAHADGSDPCTLKPRQEITPTPYALQTRGIFVDNAGNVGIGTPNPSTKFHLDGQSLWLTGGNGGGFPYSAGAGLRLYHDGSAARIWAYDYQAQEFTDMIFQEQGGNVGIGTMSPTAKLDVAGTVKANAFIGDGSGLTGIISSSIWTASGSDIYYDSGNVGIGTTSPTSLLDVFGGEIRARRDSVQYIKIRDVDPNGGFITGHSSENNKKPLYIQNLHDGSGSPRGETFISFMVGNELSPTRAMIMKESGNVGIGTMSPSHLLDVDGSLRLRQSGGGNPTASLIELGNRAGGRTYGINFNAYYDGIWKYRSSDEAASIGFEADGDLAFSTMADGAADSALTFSPRITIKNNGDVGIGTTSPSEKLDVEGNIDVSNYRVKNYRGFPRPDYDSGWQFNSTGDPLILTHSLGGNVDNYVVDLQFKGSVLGIHNRGYGLDYHGVSSMGACWSNLTAESINVQIGSFALEVRYIRIRIWVYD